MPPLRRRATRLLMFLVPSLFVPPLHSQDASTGAIRGTVLDPDSLPVASATIAMVNVATLDILKRRS